jgi:23S rRNA (adenine1618-N6)-methyltransferase
VASDILPAAFDSAAAIVENNKILKGSVTCRLQSNWSFIFKGVVQVDERFHFVMCNPPFHASADEALAATQRKVKGLAKSRAGQKKTALPLSTRPTLASTTASNFGGQQTELWCLGGEFAFIQQMIRESQRISQQVLWFTVLVSKESNLPKLQQMLKQAKACDIRAIDMAQGQKKSRILAWTFVPLDEHEAFFED